MEVQELMTILIERTVSDETIQQSQQIANYMSSITKSLSLQLKRKANSFVKLPKIESNSKQTNQKNHIVQLQSDSRKNSKLQITSLHVNSLYQKATSQNKQLSLNKAIDALTQGTEKQLNRSINNKSVIKLKPLTQEDFPSAHINEIKLGKESKQKINADFTITDAKTGSSGSSRASIHPVVNQIQGLLSDESKKFMLPVKSYNQSQTGQVSSIWWCVVDSLFISIQKIIKVKPIPVAIEKQGKDAQKGKFFGRNKTQGVSPSKEEKNKKELQKSSKKISGTVQSNTKVTIQMAKVYCCLEWELKKNQETILKYYQDQNHICLILQAMFYQKAIMFLLGTIRKWNHHEEQLYIHSLSIDLIPCVIECRKLMMDILLEAVENQQQDNKIRKPKYIARQKKLIQISKFTTMMKSQYQKYLNSLGSPNRYKIFQYPQSLKDHTTLANLQHKWRSIVFDVPPFPYILQKPNKKQYLLVIEPLNLLYKYNKKEQSLQIDPYAESFLNDVSSLFDIVIFTCVDKQSSLLNFLGVLDKAEILGILDKHFMTHFSAKLIKDINKIGGGYQNNKILVLDEKSNAKYYQGCKQSVLLIDGNHSQAKIARVNGKLVKLDDHDEDYLKNLCNRIMDCAKMGGNWQKVIVQKNGDRLEKKK